MSTTALKFALPGTWGRVDLESEASSARSVKAIAESATKRRDDLASVRHDIRVRFEQAATIAREGGASDLYIGFELMPGIPLPAWISVFPRSIDATDFAALGLDSLAEALEIGVRSSGEPGTTRRAGALGTGEIRAVRQSWRRVARVAEGDIDQDFEFVEADYWLVAGEPNRLALITFSTALADFEEEMLELFDAIVSTVRWPAGASTDA